MVRFTLNDPAGYFVVDAVSGAVTLARALSYTAMQTYNFTVSVSDMGTPPLSSGLLSVAVAIIEVNLHWPQWVGTPYSIT